MAAEAKKKLTRIESPVGPKWLPGAGVDIGTANIAVSRYRNDPKPAVEGGPDVDNYRIHTAALRDCFLTFPVDQQEVLEEGGVTFHMSDDDSTLLVLGEEAVTYASALGTTLRRPLANGFISDKEDLSKEVVKRMLEHLLGPPKVENEVAVFSIPGAPSNTVDAAAAKFHTRFFSERLRELGYTPVSLNEAVCVCYNELRSDPKAVKVEGEPAPQVFTGMSFSFGAGMINIALNFKGMLVRAFSIPFGGDFIDEAVAKSTNSPVAQITVLKEEGIDLLHNRPREEQSYHDTQTERQAEAISLMYRELLSKLREALVEFFSLPANRVDIRGHVPVIVSGGTTKADGFLALFDEMVLADLDLRMALAKNCVHAQDPMNSVTRGALYYAHARQQKLSAASGE